MAYIPDATLGIFMFPYLLLWTSIFITVTGAFQIANVICQKRWKDKVPVSKLIFFTSVFVASFTILAFLISIASTIIFGR